ncbi:MAG: CHASE3 domain-containing protein [Opitutaceae bacterium]|nr:CHASE3 domain-containing protein [Opitutaceae bacterium]
MNPPSERKIRRGLRGLLALLVVMVGASVWSAGRISAKLHGIEHANETLLTLESTLVLALNIQSGSRGYALTGDAQYLNPYETSILRIPRLLNQLRQLTADNPRQQQRLAYLERAVAEELSVMRLRIAVRREQGLAGAATAVVDGRGKKTVDAIRQTIAIMEDEERRLLAGDSAAAYSMIRRSLAVSLMSGLLALGLVAGLLRLEWLERRQPLAAS